MSLQVTVHSAEHLQDVENFGSNDPYTQVSLDFKNPKTFVKTTTHKNGGRSPEWNQTLTLENLTREHQELYVEIIDKEKLADAPIGFTAIPLRQVYDAPHHTLAAVYDVYTPEGKQKGEIKLTIRVLAEGQTAQHVNPTGSEIKGVSHIVVDHHKRIKKLENLEDASDFGVAAAAGAAILGAAFLHGKQGDAEKAEEKARREAVEAAREN